MGIYKISGNTTLEALGRQFDCRVQVSIDVDPCYGADADGNRGVYRETIEDAELIDIFDENGDEEKNPETLKAIEEAFEKYLDSEKCNKDVDQWQADSAPDYDE